MRLITGPEYLIGSGHGEVIDLFLFEALDVGGECV